MSFQEKSTLTVLIVFLATYGWYFFDVFGGAASGEGFAGYQAKLLVMVGIFIVLVAIAHIVIAILDPRGADRSDERDRAFDRMGEYIGGFVLGTGSLVTLAMAMLELPHFYIAHAILASLVLAEIVSLVTKLILYRRGL